MCFVRPVLERVLVNERERKRSLTILERERERERERRVPYQSDCEVLQFISDSLTLSLSSFKTLSPQESTSCWSSEDLEAMPSRVAVWYLSRGRGAVKYTSHQGRDRVRVSGRAPLS